VADPKFFQTIMGRNFYENSVPRIIKALERIADTLETHKKGTGIWECTECGERREVSYEDAIVIGTPYCTYCNEQYGRLNQMDLLTMK
jgi:hypothetical protein